MKNISTKIQQTTYGTHIYLICILCAHILWCHNCPISYFSTHTSWQYSLHIQRKGYWNVCKMLEMKRRKQRKSVIQWSGKQTIWNDCWYLVWKCVMRNWDHLVQDIEDYKKSMEQAERQMKSSTSVFMAAHSATMEVLGVAGKVQYNQRFSLKGLRDIRCMFCTMVFDSHEVRKRHIVSCLWTIFEATVSICYTCCKFSYGNVIATAYTSASICGFFIYENMSLSGRCHIVHFCIL